MEDMEESEHASYGWREHLTVLEKKMMVLEKKIVEKKMRKQLAANIVLHILRKMVLEKGGKMALKYT